MSASDSFENSILKLIYQNIAFTLIGDAGGLLPSATAGVLYVSLHTADPGEAGTQLTSEITYTSYARASIVRSAVGFTVTTSTVSNAGVVTFPASTGGSGTASFMGIGTAATGAGVLLFSSAITTPLAVTVGVAPQAIAGAITNVVD